MSGQEYRIALSGCRWPQRRTNAHEFDVALIRELPLVRCDSKSADLDVRAGCDRKCAQASAAGPREPEWTGGSSHFRSVAAASELLWHYPEVHENIC